MKHSFDTFGLYHDESIFRFVIRVRIIMKDPVDRIFVSFMQLLDEKKYTDAFQAVLTELGIPFSVEGPFPKMLTCHELPKQR